MPVRKVALGMANYRSMRSAIAINKPCAIPYKVFTYQLINITVILVWSENCIQVQYICNTVEVFPACTFIKAANFWLL